MRRAAAALVPTRAAVLGSIVLDTATAVVLNVNRRLLAPRVFALLTLLDNSCTYNACHTAFSEYKLCLVFTARGYAKRGICRRRVSVCLCVSVTFWYCIKTAKRRITQTTPHDSP